MMILQVERKADSHIQLRNRWKKARRFKRRVVFTVAGERAIMKSVSNPKMYHFVTFSGKLDCSECVSFDMGNVHDKNFKCYHILAAEIRWNELVMQR